MSLFNQRIVCMGSTHFSSHVFEFLHNHQVNITGFVTIPDKPAGRGLQLQSSPVKKLATELNKPLLQPEHLKDPSFLEQIESWSPDIFLVIAFRKLPSELLSIPTIGSVNLHMSLLPKYRGPAPIHWAIINGETITGLTTFLLNDIIDGGDILDQREIPISSDDTHDSLEEKMIKLAGPFMLKSLEMLCSSNFVPKPQNITGFEPKAPKLTRENTKIHWRDDAKNIYNFIRGLYSKPTAWTTLHSISAQKKWLCKIHASKFFNENIEPKDPGLIEVYQRKRIVVHTTTSPLEILTLQIEGKKTMSADAFIRGYENYLSHAKFE